MGKKRKRITRKQALRRRRITKLVFFGIIIFIIYTIFFKSNLFRIKTINVSGNKKTEKAEIIKQSTFQEGYKTFSFKRDEGINNIKMIPYIKDAEIKRKFPDKVNIKVTERKPIAMASYMNKNMLIDENGRILETRNSGEEVDLADISGLELNNIQEGHQIFQGKLAEEQIEFIEISNKKKKLNQMKYINFSDMNSIVVEMKTSEKVYFGNVNDLDYKLDYLDVILKDTKSKKKNVKRVEFNKGENPVVVTEDHVEEEITGE